MNGGNMCTELFNEGETKATDSDKTITMMASQKFYSILQEIQLSHLNFQLQLSPFSAVISLKKSFVREKDGSVRVPPHFGDKVSEADLSDYKGDNQKLVRELDTLRGKYAELVDDCASKTEELVVAKNSIVGLENKIVKAESEAHRLFEENKAQLNILKKQIKLQNSEIEGHMKEANSLKKHTKEKEKEISKLQGKSQNLESNIRRLKTEMSTLRNENKRMVKEKKKKGLSSGSNPSRKTMTSNNNNSLPLSTKTLRASLSTPSVAPILSPHETPSLPPVENVDFTSPDPATAQPCSTPPRSPRPPSPLQAGPCSPRTPPGFPTCTEHSNGDTDNMVEGSPISIVTVQDKLKEARDGGTKLDFESLVALIKNHPWGESKEPFDNDAEYDDFDYSSYEYEEPISEEEKDEPVEP